MKRIRIGISILCLLLVCTLAVNLTGCALRVQADDLMEGVAAAPVTGKAPDDAFIRSQLRLSVELFRASVLESREQNALISPLSLQLALAMTANGAAGETRREMEALLGGDIPLETLNEYLHSYANALPSEEKYRLELANSIWFRDDEDRLTVEPAFLQTNATYYGAQAYKAPFNARTLKDINLWVDKHTNGRIDKILDQIDTDAVMYLLNALTFDAEWETVYDKADVYNGSFTALSGEEKRVEMMHSAESRYLSDGKAVGFIKNYKDGKYSFAALLPNEDVDIYEYIAGLTGESLLNTLKNAQSGSVMAAVPKFSYAYELSMNEALAGLGMPSAFSGATADFTGMASSSRGNIFIGDVLHKTFIAVDERGTKAGAVTKVEMRNESAAVSEWVVTLDRPFVYMILDNSADLPVFMGVVTDI